jgi:hypothetical protein
MSSERIEAKRHLPQSPAAIFILLCQPSGHVAIDASGMLQSAEGEPVRAVGDEFVVHMDRESLGDRPLGKYDVTVIITQFEQDSLIEWTVKAFDRPPIGHLYGYELSPSEGLSPGEIGSVVTSYCDWSAIPASPERDRAFPIVPQIALRASLGILARTMQRASEAAV